MIFSNVYHVYTYIRDHNTHGKFDHTFGMVQQRSSPIVATTFFPCILKVEIFVAEDQNNRNIQRYIQASKDLHFDFTSIIVW